MKRHILAGIGIVVAASAAIVGGASAQQQAAWLGSFDASYQAAQPGDTIIVPAGTYGSQVIGVRTGLRGGTCSITDTSRCITFTMGGNVQINGQLEVHGAGIRVDGGGKLRVSGYTDTEADSVASAPDHVVFENLQTGNIGVYSSTDVTFRNVDVGPSTVGAGCNRNENKIGYGSGIEVVPRNVLFDRLYVHNQNVNAAGRVSDCHYGGLFIVTVDGLTIRNTIFERNVVYHVQVQNFSGPPARRVVFENNSFGCPVEWLDELGENTCDGQRAIQFDYDPGVEFTLTNNVAANGPNGLYGCYVGTCGGVDGNNLPLSVKARESGTVNLTLSPTAPPLLGTIPPPPPPTCPGMTLPLTKIAETQSTVTFAWQSVTGAIGYRFSYSNAPSKYSHTWDGSRSTAKFAQGSACYRVEALGVLADGGATG
jgi:hypothetical protein